MNDEGPIKKAMFDLGMVRTAFDPDHIEQMVEWPTQHEITDRMQKHVLHLREESVRRALIALGWTPPGGGVKEAQSLMYDLRAARDALTRIANAKDLTDAQWIASKALDETGG